MTQLTHTQISSSTANSCTVKTPRDEKVGSIKDIMINTQTGQVSYVVLKVNEGFLNLGSKLLALPWQSFQFTTSQDDVVIVKESKDTLGNSPGFDEENWPTGPQHEFIQSIQTYYEKENRSLFGFNREGNNHLDKEDVLSRSSNPISIKDHAAGNKFLEKKH